MVYLYPAPCLSEENQYSGGDFIVPGPSLAVCETAAVYTPRNPEESILYGVVAAQLETFLERQHRRDRIVPRFVERELRSFLECGGRMRILAAIHPPIAIRKILDCLGLPSRPPPIARALPGSEREIQGLGSPAESCS